MNDLSRFIKALERKPIEGLVPTFELNFFLTMEKFNKVHPMHRNYSQWIQMSEHEKEIIRKDIAQIHLDVAQAYGHSAIFIHSTINTLDEIEKIAALINELSYPNKYFLMVHGDATYGIPDGNQMLEFSYRLQDDSEGVISQADKSVNKALERAQEYSKSKLIHGFALCSDYCLNTGPFLSPSQFSDFVAPFLQKLIKGYRDMGFYSIKHTDGNIMPIIDQIMQAHPDALHSLDPQAGVDIAEVKKMYGDKVCLIGNVNCGLMQTGTDEEVIESARYSLKNGMPGYGYIFSTSNTVYSGMPLKRYELINKVWRQEGQYRDE